MSAANVWQEIADDWQKIPRQIGGVPDGAAHSRGGAPMTIKAAAPMGTGHHRRPAAEVPHDQSVLIGEFQANSREVARVTLDEYRGHNLVRIHKWWPDEHGEMRPGKGGIAINVKHLPRLAELINSALLHAREAGLICDGDDPTGGGAR